MANCNECKQMRAKTSDKPSTISIFEHENAMTRLERCNKRLWIALIIAISTIFVMFAVNRIDIVNTFMRNGAEVQTDETISCNTEKT